MRIGKIKCITAHNCVNSGPQHCLTKRALENKLGKLDSGELGRGRTWKSGTPPICQKISQLPFRSHPLFGIRV